MSRGSILAAFASTSAALQARSPCAIARRHDLDVGEFEPLGKRAIGLQRLERGKDAAVHERVDVHRRDLWAQAVAACAGAIASPG
jgi:hypothetical protein